MTPNPNTHHLSPPDAGMCATAVLLLLIAMPGIALISALRTIEPVGYVGRLVIPKACPLDEYPVEPPVTIRLVPAARELVANAPTGCRITKVEKSGYYYCYAKTAGQCTQEAFVEIACGIRR